MKIWLKKLFMFLALTNMVLAPLAHAQSWSKQEQIKIDQYRQHLEPLGYALEFDPINHKALVYEANTKNLVMEIPFATESQLRKFSPKNLNRMMLDEMVRVKSASKASFSHSIKGLPTESAMFFTAMGAVVAGQLITNYAQNPVAMKQHIDHSLSPLGVFGFFTFMYSQGVTSNVLSMYIKNPKFHHMIPYLGMTVGAFLQTYLSSIASDPNVKACAKVMMGGSVSDKDLQSGVEKDPCAKAYEYLVIKKKIWEFAPGIVSMLISSGLAAVAQSVVTKAVLRLTGVDIALWLVPGGMQIKGFRLLMVKGLQITMFVAIDVWLNRKVNYVWKNMYDGADFFDQNERLNTYVNEMKLSKWTANDKLLQDEVKSLRAKMTDWRMMNMSEVYESHQAWQEAIHQLTSMYNTSYAFYEAFINEVRNSRFNESTLKLLELKSPIAGVTAKDLTTGKEDLYLLNPQFLIGMQMETVADAAAGLRNFIKTEEASWISPSEKAKLQDLANLLGSDNIDKAGEAILLLHKELRALTSLGGFPSPDYHEALRNTMKALGNPDRIVGQGQSFVSAYEKAPSTAETLRGTNYYRKNGLFETPKITDYLIVQMICGPNIEKGEKSIRRSLGYPSIFFPPSIVDNSANFTICSPNSMNAPSHMIYKFAMSGATGNQYEGAIPYLLKEAKTSIVGNSSDSEFESWWIKNTEAQMRDSFEDYTKSYDAIVAKMITAIFYQGKSFFNGRPLIAGAKTANRVRQGGPIYNGGMKSAFQESRAYLALLAEIISPSKSFNLDFSVLADQAPKTPILKAVDDQFLALSNMMKRITVASVEGRPVIKSDLENYELEEQLQKIQAALTNISTILGVGDNKDGAQFKLNENQRNLAVTVLEQLQSLGTEVMMYGSMANAVSWEKIRDLKRLNTEQQKYNNDVQAKLAAMRGMSVMGKQ